MWQPPAAATALIIVVAWRRECPKRRLDCYGVVSETSEVEFAAKQS